MNYEQRFSKNQQSGENKTLSKVDEKKFVAKTKEALSVGTCPNPLMAVRPHFGDIYWTIIEKFT